MHCLQYNLCSNFRLPAIFGNEERVRDFTVAEVL